MDAICRLCLLEEDCLGYANSVGEGARLPYSVAAAYLLSPTLSRFDSSHPQRHLQNSLDYGWNGPELKSLWTLKYICMCRTMFVNGGVLLHHNGCLPISRPWPFSQSQANSPHHCLRISRIIRLPLPFWVRTLPYRPCRKMCLPQRSSLNPRTPIGEAVARREVLLHQLRHGGTLLCSILRNRCIAGRGSSFVSIGSSSLSLL